MKLLILKNNLLTSLITIEKAVGINNNLPILQNILLTLDEGKINITATNLDLAVTSYPLGKIIESGKVCIPFIVFYNIIKNINSEKIQLETQDKKLFIKIDNYEASINIQNAEDFPIIPKIKNTNNKIIFNKDLLKNILFKISEIVQESQIRPEISGVFIKINNNNINFVSTDSFRLIEKTISLKEIKSNLNELELIIPLDTIQEIIKTFNEDKEIEFCIEDKQLLIKSENQEIISHIIDSQFPDYKAIIPNNINNEFLINKKEFINGLKLSSVLSGKTNDVILNIPDNKKILELYSSDSKIGEQKYLIPIKYKGEPIKIVFNWKFLIDGLKIFDEENVVFGINGNDKPAVIKGENDKSLLYVVMPIKS
ncbi:MAG: DNA polymerase III subunit beta [Minisyncoccia bacterium]